jgi:hypothetical protein
LTSAQTFGTGPHAIRVLPRADGCEVRFGHQMLLGNRHLAQLLEYLHQDPEGDGVTGFASSFQIPPQAMRTMIAAALRDLASAGIPVEVWGRYWADIALHRADSEGS